MKKLTSKLRALYVILLFLMLALSSCTRNATKSKLLERTIKADIKSNDFRAAVADSTKAIRINSGNAQLYFVRGFAKANLNDLDGAIADYDKALLLDPKYENVYIDRAQAWVQKGAYTNALSDYTSAIALNLRDSTAYVYRGNVKASFLNDYSGAMTDFSNALDLDPQNAWAYEGRGSANHLFNRELSSAMIDFDRAIQLDPTNAAFYFNRGALKQSLKDYKGAAADYINAIELEHYFFQPYYRLGLLQTEQGHLSLALTNFNNALVLSHLPFVADRLYLVRMQLGEVKELHEELLRKSHNQGYTNVVATLRADHFAQPTYLAIEPFLAGALSEGELLQTATNAVFDSKTQRQQLCEAFFYIGMKRLIDGDRAGAIESFHKCLSAGPLKYGESGYDEYNSAEAQLQALK